MMNMRLGLMIPIFCLLFPSMLNAQKKANEKAFGVVKETTSPAEHLGKSHYALIVGINDYADAQIPDLSFCEADAKAVYEVLTDPKRGSVSKENTHFLVGEDATFRKIRKAFNDLSKIPKDATVFIYFSGHGAKEGDEGFWVTQDAELNDLAATGMPDADIRRFVGRIPADRIIVMIDACYAAATVKGGKNITTDFNQVLKKFTGKGVAYLMASGTGEEAIEANDLKRSVFTHYLVEGLKGEADRNQDGVIVLPELTTFIDDHVAREARLRGGIQKPTTIQDVQEPSKFRLTVDPERLKARILEDKEELETRNNRLAVLKDMYLNGKINLEQYKLAERLFARHRTLLNARDKKLLDTMIRVSEGKLKPELLARALAISGKEELKARFVNEVGMTMVLIKPGSYLRGSPSSELFREADETQHKVTISKPFYIGMTEVTQAQFKKVWGEVHGAGAEQMKVGDEYPQTYISHNLAIQYIKRLNKLTGKTYRLPTEAEWEYACRAGSTGPMSFAELNQLPNYAWFSFNVLNQGMKHAQPVGQKLPNAWGLYDMHGNALELCDDWYGDYPKGAQVDPIGPFQGTHRVTRGGAWWGKAANLRSAGRSKVPPLQRASFIGFRVVMEVEE